MEVSWKLLQPLSTYIVTTVFVKVHWTCKVSSIYTWLTEYGAEQNVAFTKKYQENWNLWEFLKSLDKSAVWSLMSWQLASPKLIYSTVQETECDHSDLWEPCRPFYVFKFTMIWIPGLFNKKYKVRRRQSCGHNYPRMEREKHFDLFLLSVPVCGEETLEWQVTTERKWHWAI